MGEDLTDDEIQHVFTKADLDDDGFVTGDDFYNIMTKKTFWYELTSVIAKKFISFYQLINSRFVEVMTYLYWSKSVKHEIFKNKKFIFQYFQEN